MAKAVKNWILLILGVALFAGCAFWITSFLTHIATPYHEKTQKIEKSLYSDDQEAAQADIIFVGGSHGLGAFNPNIMYEKAGFHSYNCCFAGEMIPLTRVFLEELFKKRSPKLIVLDPYYAGVANKYFGDDTFAFDILSVVKPSDSRSDYVEKHVRKRLRSQYYFPLVRFQSRLMELDERDIERIPDTSDDWRLGLDVHLEINDGTEVHFDSWKDHGQTVELADDTEIELKRIIELVRDNGAQLLIADIPRRYGDSLMPARWFVDEFAVMNRVREIAKEYDVDFFQLNDEDQERVGFVPETCMYNRGHVNIYGSEIFSGVLADYIKEHYDVPGYPRQASDPWEGYLTIYKQETAGREAPAVPLT